MPAENKASDTLLAVPLIALILIAVIRLVVWLARVF
jgi:hypothetical protein